jgi:hypothetical protein
MDAGEPRHERMVLRLGAPVDLSEVPSLPERYRQRATQFAGRLGGVFLCPDAGEVWCKLSRGLHGQVWPPTVKRVDARTLPLNDRQSPTPPPDAIELHPRMRVECRDGDVGRLEGIVIATASGTADALLVRVRGALENVVASPLDPLSALIPEQGQLLLVPPEWAKAAETLTHAFGAAHALRVEASAAQVAHSLHLRDDGDLMQAVYAMLGKSPALAPYLHDFRVDVQDGVVHLSGPSLSPRLRASLEQDIWHVPGVLAVRSDLD